MACSFRFLLSLILLLLSTIPAAATSSPLTLETCVNTPTASAPSITTLLRQANTFYAQREIKGAVPQAIKLYKKILAKDPNHFEALWRLARCYWWQGDHSPKEKQIDIYEAGKLMALRTKKTAPDRVEGHYWYGVCEGRVAEVRGILNSLFAVDSIRQAMESVLKINPKYGYAHHILGVLYRKAPGWPLSCGDLNKSLKHARLAVEYTPEEVLPRIGLAKTLLAKNKKAEAKKLLKEALQLPGPPDKQPETREYKKLAQELLKSLK